MILLDSEVLLLDLRYQRDPRFSVNQQVLHQLRAAASPGGITLQALLEIIGVLSFNLAAASVPPLLSLIPIQYGLLVVPDPGSHPDYAGCSVPELLTQMSRQMALADAVQAVQIARHAGNAQGLLTWNAKHFQGKLTIPVLTPQEWLNQQAGSTP